MTSYAPGLHALPLSLLSGADLAGAGDAELAHTVAAVLGEQHRRALEGGDVDAMVEQGFADAFTPRSEAGPPWVEAGLLFCPGSRRDKSATSHECTFVSIDGQWVWEHPGVVNDTMRALPGPKLHKLSVTVLPVTEGAKVDMVTSSARSGGSCQMRRVRSFQVRTGALVEVEARARAVPGHR